jgi:hypothetical protein
MSGIVNVARARGRKEIRNYAQLVRQLAATRLGHSGPYFPIVEFIEGVLPQLDGDFTFEVCDSVDMGDNHGLTIPSQKVIRIRNDIYEGAIAGRGRDRDTLAHELGHYILHDDIAYPRQMQESAIPAYKSAEWQAKAFSGELLVDARLIGQFQTADEVAQGCGVSVDCARYQMKVLAKEGLIKLPE